MNPNSTPSEGLYGPVTASGAESEARGPGAANEPQKAAQGVDPRALILDTISTAINQAGYWLAIEGKRAAADAVAALPIYGDTEWRTRAVRGAIRSSELAETLDAAREWARRNLLPEQRDDLLRILRSDTTASDALDQPKEPPPTPAAHVGGNAEDCPACEGSNPPYPFLCPKPAA